MEAKVKCPNTNCSAPAGSYLIKKGFSTVARQVSAMRHYYTVLTQWLTCTQCHKMWQAVSQTDQDSDGGREEEEQAEKHLVWYRIMASLAPAVRSLFPAILFARRSVDRNVVTLLSDRVKAMSMSKVQRLVQQGHDEWYTEERSVSDTALWGTHRQHSLSAWYTVFPQDTWKLHSARPVPQSPIPSTRLLLRAHLNAETVKILVYRPSILSVTGEIPCINGTRQVCTLYDSNLLYT